jgi:hypothetical protein
MKGNTDMHTPIRPADDQIPAFGKALRTAPKVMKHYGAAHLLCWVMYADDSIGLHKFNRNGSHKRIAQ